MNSLNDIKYYWKLFDKNLLFDGASIFDKNLLFDGWGDYRKNGVVCQGKNEHFILWMCEDGRMSNNKGGLVTGRNLGC